TPTARYFRHFVAIAVSKPQPESRALADCRRTLRLQAVVFSFATVFVLVQVAFGGSLSDNLNGASSVIGNILVTHQIGLITTLYFIAVLLLCKVLTRNTPLAVGLFTVLLTLSALARIDAYSSVWYEWILLVLFPMGIAMLYIRFSLLSVVTGLFCYYLLGIAPHTTDFGAWYAVIGNFAKATVLLVACYGFYTNTLADRSPSREVVRQ
ncbi:MAG: hypothetical protein ABGX16_24130, partial [Pirellulales bacterium]